MRSFLFLSVFVLLCHTAFAGLPSEDKQVSWLRDHFISGKTPTIEQLEPGKVWNCRLYKTIEGNFERTDIGDYFQFYNDGQHQVKNYGKARIKDYRLFSAGLVGVSGVNQQIVRIISPGVLVSEWTHNDPLGIRSCYRNECVEGHGCFCTSWSKWSECRTHGSVHTYYGAHVSGCRVLKQKGDLLQSAAFVTRFVSSYSYCTLKKNK